MLKILNYLKNTLSTSNITPSAYQHTIGADFHSRLVINDVEMLKPKRFLSCHALKTSKLSLYCESFVMLRKDRDSNPGTPKGVNGFRDRPVRPLRHLSNGRFLRVQS